jgi:DNA-binding SARP family transcriptional activator
MEFRILGPLEVQRDGKTVRIAAPRQRALLALLLLRANDVVPLDELIDRLWDGEPPPSAKAVLQNTVSALRKVLGAEVVETVSPGYRLNVVDHAVDVRRFERLCADARGATAEIRASRLRQALAQWRGPPLVDFPFADAEIVRLEELRFAALEERIDADLELGRHGALVSELEALVLSYPLRERLWAQLMVALYRSGRQAEALSTYRRAHRAFVDELGIEPGPNLKELQRAVLVQDARLEAGAKLDPSELLERAGALLPTPDYATRAQSLVDYSDALFRLGERERAAAVLEEAAAQGARSADTVVSALIDVRRVQRAVSAGRADLSELLAAADRAMHVVESAGDSRRLAKVLNVRAVAMRELGRAADALVDLERALTVARESGDEWQVGWTSNMIGMTLMIGPVPAPEALDRCQELLAAIEWGPPGPLGLWISVGILHAQLGRAGDGRRSAEQAVTSSRDADLKGEYAVMQWLASWVDTLAGDSDSAERRLRTALDLFDAVGDASAAPAVRAELARVLVDRGQHEEPEALANVARAGATSDDLIRCNSLRRALALVEAGRGNADLSRELARDAVDAITRTDWLNHIGGTLEDAGRVEAILAGDPRPAVRRAVNAYRAKGNLVGAARAQRLLNESV